MNRLASKLPSPANQPRASSPSSIYRTSDSANYTPSLCICTLGAGPRCGLWRCVRPGMGEADEAAEWLRTRAERFAVIEWAVEAGRLTWRCHVAPSQRAALDAIRAM